MQTTATLTGSADPVTLTPATSTPVATVGSASPVDSSLLTILQPTTVTPPGAQDIEVVQGGSTEMSPVVSGADLVAAIAPLETGSVNVIPVTGVEASVPPASPAQPFPATAAPAAATKPLTPTPQAPVDPLTGEALGEDLVLAQIEPQGDVPPPVRQTAGSYLDMDALSMLLVGGAIAGTALAYRESTNDDDAPEIIVDPGPPAGPGGPGGPDTPVPPVTPEPPAAAPVTLFDPTEAIVEGFELDGPLVGVAETLQTVSESALAPLVGESFQPSEPGTLDGTDGVLGLVVGAVPGDLLETLGNAVDRPVPMDFNNLLLDQLDVVTDAATVLVVDNPISSVLGGATGPDSSPAGVLNFVDNLVSGEQLGTSVPPITSALTSLPGSLSAVLSSLGTV